MAMFLLPLSNLFAPAGIEMIEPFVVEADGSFKFLFLHSHFSSRPFRKDKQTILTSLTQPVLIVIESDQETGESFIRRLYQDEHFQKNHPIWNHVLHDFAILIPINKDLESLRYSFSIGEDYNTFTSTKRYRIYVVAAGPRKSNEKEFHS
jgi:hypothetical protein